MIQKSWQDSKRLKNGKASLIIKDPCHIAWLKCIYMEKFRSANRAKHAPQQRSRTSCPSVVRWAGLKFTKGRTIISLLMSSISKMKNVNIAISTAWLHSLLIQDDNSFKGLKLLHETCIWQNDKNPAPPRLIYRQIRGFRSEIIRGKGYTMINRNTW